MVKADDFFIQGNRVDKISEKAYKQATLVINAFKSVARLTYQSIYIIDYFKKGFFYVSDNPLFLCGLQSEEVMKMGYLFYEKHVPEAELDMLSEINMAGFEFYNKFSIEECMNLYISYDFHLLDKGQKILINHKLTPILLADNGHIWLAACIVSLSSHQKAGNIEAHMDGRSDYWTYSLANHTWKHQDAIRLTIREKEVLIYSAQGFTEEKIDEKMYLKKESVKYHKQNLYNKLNVKNMSAAITIESHKKMI